MFETFSKNTRFFNSNLDIDIDIFHDQLYVEKYFKINLEIRNFFFKILHFSGTFGIRACLESLFQKYLEKSKF